MTRRLTKTDDEQETQHLDPENKVHPNSLKNLAPYFTKENAREAQRLSAISRKANREARDRLKLSMQDWVKYKEEVLDETGLGAVDVLRILMYRSLDEGDMETASELAKSVAEFEAPKLARIESKVEAVKADELSVEELEAQIAQYKDK